MIAGDTLTRQLPYWLIERRAYLGQMLAPAPALALAVWLSAAAPPEALWMALIAYALVHLWLFWVAYHHPVGIDPRAKRRNTRNDLMRAEDI